MEGNNMRPHSIYLALVLVLSAINWVGGDSLWTPNNTSLFADLKPRQVGDLITVLIVEESASQQKATQSFDKSFEHGNSAGTGPILKLIPELAYDSSQTSSTQGQMTISNKFVTTVTAKVVAVNPNGTLEIQAERTIELNGEKQELVLTGTVRPQDITADNTVLSTLIANANIQTKGKGPIGNRQKEGIITKILGFLF
jgi:flagellar L-ring protein precursor FlgH